MPDGVTRTNELSISLPYAMANSAAICPPSDEPMSENLLISRVNARSLTKDVKNPIV
ncbi:hypothetical protein HRbin04_01198 [archaeon HR04]|nr:hypothetical protein HRbin04_01198 [archaeon HR04]